MNNRQINAREITLKNIWEIFLKNWIVIVVAAVLAAVIPFAVIQLTYTPQYNSTATLYVLKQSDNSTGNADPTVSDFSLALNVINDCSYLIKDRVTLDKVIEQLSYEIEPDVLKDRITVTNPTGTRILEVSVKADTPELAKETVDILCSVGTETIADAMGFSQVNPSREGVLEEEPSNKMPAFMYVLFALVAAVMAYAVFLIIYIFDDRLSTAEDIRNQLGLTVLGEIPDVNSKKRGFYGYQNKLQPDKNDTSGMGSMKGQKQ